MLTLAWVLIVLLSACGGSPSADEAPAVDWASYSADTRTRIDNAVEAKDCAALQGEFDTADGHSSTDLMVYLDAAMERVGCYE